MTVHSWLDAHPREVVILSCSHFEGMDGKVHESFILSLKELFGSKLCPRMVCWAPRHILTLNVSKVTGNL